MAIGLNSEIKLNLHTVFACIFGIDGSRMPREPFSRHFGKDPVVI